MTLLEIRGVGLCTAAGSSTTELWQTLMADEVELATETVNLARRGKVTQLRVIRSGAPINNVSQYGVQSDLALAVCERALGESPWLAEPKRRAIVYASSFFGAEPTIDFLRRFEAGTPIHAMTLAHCMPNATAARLSQAFRVEGPAMTIGSACAGGAEALLQASRLCKNNEADEVLVVCADCIGEPELLLALSRAGVLDHFEDGRRSYEPFGLSRRGLLAAEGACAALVSPVSTSLARGNISSIASGTEAVSMLSPQRGSSVLERLVRTALDQSGHLVNDVAAVVAHGSGTQTNDVEEAELLLRVFGNTVPVLAVKSRTGHLMATSSLVQILLACEVGKRRLLPPNALSVHDPAIGICLPTASSTIADGPIVTLAAGLGGHVSVAVIG